MVSAYYHYRRAGPGSQRSELTERVLDSEVARANDVEQITGDQYNVGLNIGDGRERCMESLEYIGFTAVETLAGYSIVSAVTQVRVRDVCNSHGSCQL